MIISYVVNPHDHAHYWGDAIRPMAIAGETHGGRLGCLGCGLNSKSDVFLLFFGCHGFHCFSHVFPTIPMQQSDVIPFPILMPLIPLCCTWEEWGMRHLKTSHQGPVYHLVFLCWLLFARKMLRNPIKNDGAGGVSVRRIHELCQLCEAWKAIHIQLAYDCPGFKLINSPMTGTIRSSEKIWQDIP